MDLVWNDVLAANHNGKLSQVLTAFDRSITKHAIDPCSELALSIYSQIIKDFREGKLQREAAPKLSMFSFGKENPFGAVVSVDRVAKQLKFQDLGRTPSTKRLQKKRSGDTSLARTAARSVDIDTLERQLRKALDLKNKTETLLWMRLKLRSKKLTQLRKARMFKLLQEKVHDESPGAISRRLRRFKKQSAIFHYESVTQRKCFSALKAYICDVKTSRRNRLQSFLQNKQSALLASSFSEWRIYTNRREDERQEDIRLSALKKDLRKKLFLLRLNRWRFRKENNAVDDDAASKLQKLLFLIRMRCRTTPNNDAAVYQVVRQIWSIKTIDALRQNLNRYAGRVRILTDILNNRRKSRFITRLYFSKEFTREYWLRKGPRQTPFVKLLTDALAWQYARQGYHYQWMNNIKVLSINPRASSVLNKRLLQRTFRQLSSRLSFERKCMQTLRSDIAGKAVRRIKQWYNQKKELRAIKETVECLFSQKATVSKTQWFNRFACSVKLRAKINELSRIHCEGLIHGFFGKLKIQKLSNNYVHRQLNTHLAVKNDLLLRKVFASLKSALLEEVYSGKILAIARQKKSAKQMRDIFRFLKNRAFETKRINVKAKNLIKLRKLEHGEKLIKQLKDWMFVSHHRQGIKNQACRLRDVSVLEKCIEFWRVYANHRIYQREVEQRLKFERSRFILNRCFQALKARRDRKQNERANETPILRRLLLRRKKNILNKIVEQSLLSMKFNLLVQASTNLLKRTAFTRINELAL